MIGAHLLEPQAHEKILTFVAAPGGKSTHIIQLTGGNVTVFAGDPHFSRVGLIFGKTPEDWACLVFNHSVPTVCALRSRRVFLIEYW